MNARAVSCLALALVCQLPLASAQDASQSIGVVDEAVVTLTLGSPPPAISIVPTGQPAPVDVRPGSTIRFEVGIPVAPGASIEWRKNDQPLAASGPSLEIARASISDSGRYHALVRSGESSASTATAAIRVFPTEHQRLLGLASRTTLSSNNRTLISGFVIEPGSNTGRGRPVLIRAVGPSLAALGVSNPLAHPTLRLFLANGTDWDDLAHTQDLPFYPLSVEDLARIAGVSPLLPNSADVARAFVLPPGAFTVHVASADDGAGDVLLEIYELPEAVLLAPWTYLQAAPLPLPLPPDQPQVSVGE